MSPEEYALKIRDLISEAEEETGFWFDIYGGEMMLKKWDQELGRYEVVDI